MNSRIQPLSPCSTINKTDTLWAENYSVYVSHMMAELRICSEPFITTFKFRRRLYIFIFFSRWPEIHITEKQNCFSSKSKCDWWFKSYSTRFWIKLQALIAFVNYAAILGWFKILVCNIEFSNRGHLQNSLHCLSNSWAWKPPTFDHTLSKAWLWAKYQAHTICRFVK